MKPIEKKEKEIAQAAIKCRKVRLFVAANPGLTAYEIFMKTNIRAGDSLMRMSAMGLVGFTQTQEGDRRPQRWFVIPQ